MTAVVNQNLNLDHLPVDEPVATQGPFGPFARISKMQIREKQDDSTNKLVFNYDRGLDLIEIPVDQVQEACRFLLDSSKCKEAEGKGEMVSLTVPSFKSSFRLHAKIYSVGSLYGIHIDDDASDSPKVCDGWTLKDRRRSKRKRDDGDDAPAKKQKSSSGDEASDEVSKEELRLAKNHLSALIGKTDPTDDDIKEFQAQNNKMKQAVKTTVPIAEKDFTAGLATPEEYKIEFNKLLNFNTEANAFKKAYKRQEKRFKAEYLEKLEEVKKRTDLDVMGKYAIERTLREDLKKRVLEAAGIEEPKNESRVISLSNDILMAVKPLLNRKVQRRGRSAICTDQYETFYNMLKEHTESSMAEASDKAKLNREKIANARKRKREAHAAFARDFNAFARRELDKQRKEAEAKGETPSGIVHVEF